MVIIMKKREIKKYSKAAVLEWAKTVLTKHCNCEISKIHYVGGGFFGYVYYAEINKQPNRLIMKACLSPDMCVSEERDLKLLGENSFVPIPEVYFTYKETKDIPIDFICMEYMPGKDVLSSFNPVKLAFVSKSKKDKFADDIVTAMGVWHSRKNDKFGLTGNAVYDDWFAYYKPFARDILETAEKHNSLFPEKVLRVMQKAWDKFDIIFCEKVEKAVLVHGDLNVLNIMCDNRLNVTAIIDPLESKWADREFDLFQLRNFTGDQLGLYNAYKAKYPVSENVDAKCAFYGLFNEVYCSILADIKMSSSNRFVKWMEKELKNF